MTLGKIKTTGKKYKAARSLLRYLIRLLANIIRMPVILNKKDEDVLLNPDIVEADKLHPLLEPFPFDNMEEWKVGAGAKNPRNDNPDVIEPLKTNKQRTLF